MKATLTPRRLVLLLAAAALLLATLSYWLSDRYLRERERQVEQRVADRTAQRRVVVARVALAKGALLRATDLAVREVPERYLASDVIATDGVETVLGGRLARDLVPGEPLTRSTVDIAGGASLSAALQPGSRAITISVDDASSAAGLLTPGDLVDLFYLPSALPGGDGESRIQPLLQSITVLATGRQTQRNGNADPETSAAASEFATIALDVTAEQAERVALAAHTGEITAVLRPAGEVAEATLEPVTLSELVRGAGAAHAARHRRSDAVRIDYIVGGVAAGERLSTVLPVGTTLAARSEHP